MDNDLVARIQSLENQVKALTTQRVDSGNISPTAVQPIHLVAGQAKPGDVFNLDSNGSFYNLPIGTAGQLLTVSGGYPAWKTISSGFIPTMPIGKYVKISGSNLPIGNNDLYTVPTGKKCIIFGATNLFTSNYNPSAGSISYTSQIKISGTYYRLRQTQTLATLAGDQGQLSSMSLVLNAGESISINTTTTAGLNTFGVGYEYDDTNTSIVTSRILNLANGDNTLYTVPTGKSAVFLNVLHSFAISGSPISVVVANSSGGTRTYNPYIVPSGISASSAYKVAVSQTLLTGTSGIFILGSALNAGDSIIINSDGGTAGQLAYATVYEI